MIVEKGANNLSIVVRLAILVNKLGTGGLTCGHIQTAARLAIDKEALLSTK